MPTESMLVTSSYVIVPPTLIDVEKATNPVKVPATPVTFLTVMSGVPVSAAAEVALPACN